LASRPLVAYEGGMSKIVRIHAREVLDSRGKPAVEVEVHLAGGIVGRASVPSGASTGAAEAHELRDNDSPWYDGLGVQQAVRHVLEKISPALAGKDPTEQAEVDALLVALDGTANKSRLGANALLGVSLACARAAALAKGLPLFAHLNQLLRAALRQSGAGLPRVDLSPKLPLPMTNMISGGKHAGGNLDIQDVLVIPAGAADYRTGLEWIVRVYWQLGKLLRDAGHEGRLVGDEGGYGPRLATNREAIQYVIEATQAVKLRPGREVAIALDVAASHFYKQGKYQLAAENQTKLTSSQMIDRLEAWVGEFPIISIEDGLAESDWTGWKELTARLGSRVKLVGDDLFATNDKLLQRGIDEKVANAVLIKVNQIGTLSETLRTMLLARQHGYTCIVSARSGETEDDLLADLAVGTAADYIKIGGVARSERLAKYNRLLRIAEEL
jgi:enolase